jgi:ornithine cyclodeaminase
MLTLDAAHTAALLPYPELAEEIGRVLRQAAAGEVHALERGTTPLPGGGTFLSMAATDADVAIVKVGSVHPLNSQRGLPTVQAVVVALSAVDGTPRVVLDGTTVTTRRTAALSLLAARRLGARGDTAVIVGAGSQAHGHLDAMHQGLGLKRVRVYGRRQAPGAALVAKARMLGLEAELLEPTEGAFLEALKSADLVITTTNATRYVVPPAAASLLMPHATVLAVGAFTPAMAELAPQVVARCDVVVDTLTGAESEAGDLIQAAAAGVWSWDSATELVTALNDYERSDRPVLFKSVGHSMFDLAAAKLALRLS